MAFIVGGLIFVATIVGCIAIMMGNMMQSAPMPSNQKSILPTLIIGMILSATVISSHWMHFTW